MSVLLMQDVGEEGREREEGGEGDKEWEDYTKAREKRLKMMEELWEDEDTRKRKRRCVWEGEKRVCVCVNSTTLLYFSHMYVCVCVWACE